MKNLLLILMILGLSCEALAQDQAVGPNTRKKFKIGFNLSPSIDFFQPNTKDVKPYKVRAKFGYGIMSEYAFTNNYAIAFGLEHKMGGAALDFSEADVRYMAKDDTTEYQLMYRTYRYDYVTLPITLKLMTNQIGYFTYFGQFGVDISILATAKTRDETRTLESYETDTIAGRTEETFGEILKGDFQGRYTQASFANIKLRVGAGFEWNFSGNTSLVVSVSYHNGFIDLMKDPNKDKVDNDEGLYSYDENRDQKPFELNANLHHVALNVGILF